MRISPIAITEIPTRFHSFTHKRSADFWLFEGSIWLHVFASSLISIFIPILMLNSGFELKDVLLFYIVYHVVNVPANFIAAGLTSRVGPRIPIILGTLFSIAFFVVYSQIGGWEDILLMAILYAVYDALYYTAALSIFINSTKDPENTGENTGILHLVVRSASLLGPVLGSALVVFSGGNTLVVVSVVVTFFIFSIIPLFFLKNITSAKSEKLIKPREFFNNKRETKNHLSFGLYKIQEAVEYIIFPIFIFTLFDDLESVAVLAILMPIVSLVFSYVASHIKRSQREKTIMIGALLLALVWMVRLFVDSQILLYATSIATGFFALFVLVPLDANMFLRGGERGAINASAYRNAVSMGSKALLFIFLYISVETFNVPFVIAIAALLGLVYVNHSYLSWRKSQPGEQTSVPGLPKQ